MYRGVISIGGVASTTDFLDPGIVEATLEIG
jgi:hypothetical protein